MKPSSLAALVIRFLAILLGAYALYGFYIILQFTAFPRSGVWLPTGRMTVFFSVCLLVAVVLCWFSRQLGQLIARGLD